ncbi:hypothetical protein GCM10010129_79650 [Streptomyces fumigatiscleroticus]|nr:hypothetical protein GCM10010129_79650 [Streptomyces fumigatiscleroticus]
MDLGRPGRLNAEGLMGRAGPQWVPALRAGGRCTRLLNLVQRLLAERKRPLPACTNCQDGQDGQDGRLPVRAPDGRAYTIACPACDGTGMLPERADTESDGPADGR